MKRVMVFGVFDGLHNGHRNMIEQAKKFGDELVIVVARDVVVRKLKNKNTRHNEYDRIIKLKAEFNDASVILGDIVQGSYEVVMYNKPDIICLGYDQEGFKINLQNAIKSGTLKEVELITLKPYKPEQYKSSLYV